MPASSLKIPHISFRSCSEPGEIGASTDWIHRGGNHIPVNIEMDEEDGQRVGRLAILETVHILLSRLSTTRVLQAHKPSLTNQIPTKILQPTICNCRTPLPSTRTADDHLAITVTPASPIMEPLWVSTYPEFVKRAANFGGSVREGAVRSGPDSSFHKRQKLSGGLLVHAFLAREVSKLCTPIELSHAASKPARASTLKTRGTT